MPEAALNGVYEPGEEYEFSQPSTIAKITTSGAMRSDFVRGESR
jgi:hypothetical protein